jgi:hypothetical protein
MRRVLFLLAPRWLALHVLVVAACVTMVLLGRWQWHVAHVHHGSVQNYAYAFQWWAFTGFALLMWLRVVRDAIPRRLQVRSADEPTGESGPDETPASRPTNGEPAASEANGVAYRRYVMPRTQPETADPELNAYNAYLADLDRRNRGG